MQLAVLVLFLVLFLLIIRRIGKLNFPMWFSMTLGAFLVMLLGQITLKQAFSAVQWPIIFFLLGMFIVGAAVDASGILKRYAFPYLARISSPRKFLFLFIFAAGFLSAFLMNDTIAIILTPFALWCAKRYHLPAKTMLFTLAASVTTGSVMTPIGAPPNLLIAIEGLNGSFLPFLVWMFIPALIGLAVVYFSVSFSLRSYKSAPQPTAENVSDFIQTDSFVLEKKRLNLLFLTKMSLVFVFLSVLIYIGLSLSGASFPIVAIAFAGALPLLLFSDRRLELIKKVDWLTLLFFISMFILIESVSMTGFFENFIPENFASSVPVLYATSLLLSQFISNVPYVSLVLPLLKINAAPVLSYMALAAGNTVAGNLTIFGAASNVIIIQNAEKSGETLTFFEFLKFGLPVVVMQSVVFVGWLLLLSFLMGGGS